MPNAKFVVIVIVLASTFVAFIFSQFGLKLITLLWLISGIVLLKIILDGSISILGIMTRHRRDMAMLELAKHQKVLQEG